MQEIIDEVYKVANDHTIPMGETPRELLFVLGRILNGKPPLKAFGAPGDWGYDTPMGQALMKVHQGPVDACYRRAVELAYSPEHENKTCGELKELLKSEFSEDVINIATQT